MRKLKLLIEKIKNIDFEVTFDCNLHCLHCYNGMSNNMKELSTEKILDIISQMKEIGFKEIHINGGEPLKHKEIMKILKFANDIGLKTLLETNATLLDKFIEQIKELPNISIRASIDGPKEIHNIIRRSHNKIDSFGLGVTNLKKAKEANISLQVTCSVNKINYNNIYLMVEQLINEGIEDIRLRLSMPSNSAYIHWTILKLSKKDFKEVNHQIGKIKKDFPNIKFDGESIRRTAPLFEPKFFITPNGDVKPYPFIDYFIGNLKNESIKDILLKFKNIKLPKEEEKRMIEYLKELGLQNGEWS